MDAVRRLAACALWQSNHQALHATDAVSVGEIAAYRRVTQ
jgi:hypothetical protein